MKLMLLYRHRWLLIYLPILLALAVALAMVTRLWHPLPPPRLVIGTGPNQSSYLRLAQLYASRLEHHGIAVDLVTHPRPQDALQHMKPGDGAIDATFAQGLYAPANASLAPADGVQALAVIGHEIIWVFAREDITDMGQLRGRRIATSVAGSSNRIAADLLLAHLHIRPDEVKFVPEVGDSAIASLTGGRVDAVIHVATGDSQTANALARLDGVHILGMERAGALAARERRLRTVVMPQGAIELRSQLPASDLPTMVTQTHLLARPGLHPALQRALLDVAGELHVMSGFLESPGRYPTTVGSDFPVSPVALQHASGMRPWMETLLPFGMAQRTELFLYAVLPLSLLGVALLLRAPRYIDWRVDAALQHIYGEVRFMEEDLARQPAHKPVSIQPLLERLDTLERQVAQMQLPNRYAGRGYTLRQHLYQTRQRLIVMHAS
ncbi:MAG: ABC transporter substrate-binding protein [Gammaproteobacteria bacterium]|nr:ABC transporter substrate-binding protein [Gammaproteobacteria bacterium]MBV1733541.1 ABC transporter substrate-binding protein [Hydrogenophaga sp.]